MIRQITTLGGQLLPVYWGLLEKQPKEVHVLYTKESRHFLTRLTSEFNSIKFHTYQVDPYDFLGIKELVADIICEHEDDQFQLNLTSGTKVMALACQSVVSELEHEVFYIDQKHRIVNLSDETSTEIQAKIKIKTFIELSGHTNYRSLKYSDYSENEKEFAESIFEQSKLKSGIKELFKIVRKQCDKIESRLNYSFQDGNLEISWKNNNLRINVNGKVLLCTSPKAFQIAFGGLWWEIVIAGVTQNWKRSIEQVLGLSISTKVNNLVKNEIDIVLNTGKNLIFIECKSGNVTQDDINKIKAVSRLYGGVSSKSILVCRYIPRKDILEKCQDLGIEVFSFQTNYSSKSSNVTQFKSLNEINKQLDLLVNRLEL